MPLRLNVLDSSSSSDEETDIIQPHRRTQRRKIYRERMNFDFFLESVFIERFRISRKSVEKVLNAIGAQIKHRTQLNQALTAEQQLLIALHFFGTGCQYHGISDMHGVHKSTVSRIIHRVTSAILRTLFHSFVRWPNNCGNIQVLFSQFANFPRVAGIVDGTLIPIIAPSINESDFVDRHGQHSLNAMVVCGPNHEFYYASARWPGSVHDHRILRNSSLYLKWEIEGNYEMSHNISFLYIIQ